eukprot:symbB.v1.2.036053.t2/scaffold5001.1/size31928/1
MHEFVLQGQPSTRPFAAAIVQRSFANDEFGSTCFGAFPLSSSIVIMEVGRSSTMQLSMTRFHCIDVFLGGCPAEDEVSTSSGTEKAMCGTAGSLLNFSDGGVMHFSMLFRRCLMFFFGL